MSTTTRRQHRGEASGIALPDGKWPLFCEELSARRFLAICQAAGVDGIEAVELLIGNLLREALCGGDAAEEGDEFDGLFGFLLKNWTYTDEERSEIKRQFLAMIREEEQKPTR